MSVHIFFKEIQNRNQWYFGTVEEMIQKKDAEMRGDGITQKRKPIIISGPV